MGSSPNACVEIANDLGGVFQARLKCDSLGLCLAAVRTGKYAAVLPTYILDEATAATVEVVEADLEELNRPMAFIWNPRTVEMLAEALPRHEMHSSPHCWQRISSAGAKDNVAHYGEVCRKRIATMKIGLRTDI